METLQHFLLFLIQFTFVVSLSTIVFTFVNYVVPSPINRSVSLVNNDVEVGESAEQNVEQSETISELVCIDNEADIQSTTKANSLFELLCMSDRAIERTKQNHRKLQPPIVETIDRSDTLLCIDLDRITLRQARKIAGTLGIKQKVNGKDQPKSWLIKQIEQKLKEEPDSAAIVNEILVA